MLIPVAIIVLILLWLVFSYNTLVTKRNRVKEAYSQIDVQLKRRSSLIPNLVETVKGYAAHEKKVLEEVTAARTALMNASGPKQQAKANDQLSSTLKSLFAVAENYPNLKASDNFKELQEELSDTETKVAASRQFYNNNVLDFNTAVQTFPGSVFAGIFHFTPEEFFQASEGEKADIKVKF